VTIKKRGEKERVKTRERDCQDEAGRLAGQEEFKEVTKKEEEGRKTKCLEGGEGVLEVGDVLDELDGAATNEEVVVHHAAHSDHGQAPILELHKLAAGQGLGVLAAAKGIEAEVTRHTLRALERLDDSGNARERLEQPQPQEQLLHRALLITTPPLLSCPSRTCRRATAL
jgi:hypothetical protein